MNERDIKRKVTVEQRLMKTLKRNYCLNEKLTSSTRVLEVSLLEVSFRSESKTSCFRSESFQQNALLTENRAEPGRFTDSFRFGSA